jgi:hypothetical protein
VAQQCPGALPGAAEPVHFLPGMLCYAKCDAVLVCIVLTLRPRQNHSQAREFPHSLSQSHTIKQTQVASHVGRMHKLHKRLDFPATLSVSLPSNTTAKTMQYHCNNTAVTLNRSMFLLIFVDKSYHHHSLKHAHTTLRTQKQPVTDYRLRKWSKEAVSSISQHHTAPGQHHTALGQHHTAPGRHQTARQHHTNTLHR